MTGRHLPAGVALAAMAMAACGGGDDAAPGAGSAGAAGAAGAGGASGGCDARAVDVPVAEMDLNGYPPYAIDGCTLAYIAAPSSQTPSALVLRDLSSHEEQVLSPGAHLPRRPSISGDIVAWEATIEGSAVVRVSFAGDARTVSGPFHHAGEPRATADAVVLTGWLGADEDGDTDVFVYEPESDAVELVGGGVAQQRFADISPTHVVFSDFSEDPGGVYDIAGIAAADVVVVDRQSGELTTRPVPEKQAYPMLGSPGRVAYLEWTDLNRPVPKLEGYAIRSVSLADLGAEGELVAVVETDPPSIRPAAVGVVVEWVTRVDGVSRLHRAPADGSLGAVVVPGLDGLDLFAPAASHRLTILATREGSAPPELLAIDR